jgi:hypothetical protein
MFMKKIAIKLTAISMMIFAGVKAQNIDTVVVSGSSFCTGETFSVNCTISGSFDVSNVFTVELSNEQGAFNSTITIGSSASPLGISCTLTDTLIPSGNYRIRVLSSNPSDLAVSAVFSIGAPAAVSVINSALCTNSSGILVTTSPAGGNLLGSPGLINGFFYPQLVSAGTYNLVYVIPGNVCGDTAIQQVTVNGLPVFSISPTGNQFLCANENLLIVASSAQTGLTYSWNTGSTNDTLQVTGAGVYNVVASNAAGCTAASSSVNISTSAAPPNFSIINAGTYCQSNLPQLLSGIPGGGFFTGNNVSGGYFTPADTGLQVITYTYTNSVGCVFTLTDTLLVIPLPQPVFSAIPFECLSSDSVNLSTYVNPTGGIFSGLGVSGNYFLPQQTGLGLFPLTYTYTDANACSQSVNQTIQVQPTPIVSLALPVSSVCVGSDSVLLSGGVPAGGIFSGTGVGGNLLDPQTVGTGITQITYTYTNSAGCSASAVDSISVYSFIVNTISDTAVTCGDPVPLSASTNGAGNITYTWSPPVGLSSINIPNPIATPQGNSTYVVLASDGQCTDKDTVIIQVSGADFSLDFTSAQTLNVPPFNVVFANNTPNLSAYNFIWDFGDGFVQQNNGGSVPHQYLFDGTYNVKLIAEEISTGCRDTLLRSNWITCSNGCTHTSVISQVGPIQACQGDSVLLSASTNAPGSVLYQWNFNGLPISGAPNSAYYPTQSGFYSVTIFSNSCPQTSLPIQVTFLANPPLPVITPNGNTQFCVGNGSVELQATAGYQGYVWRRNSQFYGTGQSITVYITGEYTVEATASSGCTSRSATYGLNTSFLQQANLCVVTVDTTAVNWNRNIISWEKPITNSIAGFIIYRETSTINVFDSIAYVPYTAYSEYIDAGAGINPQARSYRYRLAVVDTCGSWSLPGSTHRTMLLQTNQGINNTINLNWNHYQGITINSYEVLRGTNGGNLVPLDTLPSNINSYTDINPPDTVVYRINLIFPAGYSCTPSARMMAARKRGASNISTNLIYPGEIPFDVGVRKVSSAPSGLKISPNPSTGHFTIQFTVDALEETFIEVSDLAGKLIRRESVYTHDGENIKQLHLGNAERGVYFLTIRNSGGGKTQKIVIQ